MRRDISHLREQLFFFVLNRGGKKAAYWTAPLTIRMNDKAGGFLYKIFGKENCCWSQNKDRLRLNGCSCSRVAGKAGDGETYHRF